MELSFLFCTVFAALSRGECMGYVRGDTVVHPYHGAALVTGVTQKDVGGGPTDYLELFVDHASLKIMVPAAAVAQVGIRDVCTKNQAEEVLALLESDADVRERWADRNAATVARMKSADLSGFAMVVRDLTRHAQRTGKPLSSNERTARDACISRLARELSLSLQLSEDEATALIIERCAVTAASS